MTVIHATTIAWQEKGLLLRGKAQSGKSELALRLIYRGAKLVADDMTKISKRGNRLFACLPQDAQDFRGILALREVGLCRMPYQQRTQLYLVADMTEKPLTTDTPSKRFCELIGITIAHMFCHPFEAAADLKMLCALQKQGSPNNEALP